MNAIFLKSLHCPLCRSKLKVSKSYASSNKKLTHGIVNCSCAEYPILDGVLFLARDRIRIRVLEFVKVKHKRLSTLSDIPFFLLGFPLGTKLPVRLLSFFSNFNLFKHLSFSQFIRALVFFKIFDRQWGDYLLYRLKEKIFFPGAISVSLVKKGSYVLDAGCGTGHLLYLLKGKTEEEKLCGVDKRLINLYLAKKYFSSNSNYIYCDLDYSLPFSNNYFNYIFCNDTFHYVGSQKQLANEFRRVDKKDGLIILNHLHNRKFAEQFKNPNEYSNTPLGYISRFPNFDFSVFSEKKADQGELEYVKGKDIKIFSKKLDTFTLIFSKKSKDSYIKNNIKTDTRHLETKKV